MSILNSRHIANLEQISDEIGFEQLRKLSIDILQGKNNWQLKEQYKISLGDIRYLSKMSSELQLFIYNRTTKSSEHILKLVA